MSTPLTNVVLIGGSGTVGKIILEALLKSPDINVTVISRDTSNATFPSQVTVHRTDFSHSGLFSAFKGQDVVISAVGATAFTEQKKFIEAAVHAGVKRFIPSEFSSNTLNESVRQMLPLFNQKKEVLDYLKSKESVGLTWTGIATALLFDWGLTSGFLGYDIPNRTATIWDGGDKRFTLVNERELGQSVVSVLKHPQETANKYLYVTSVEVTQNEILRALKEETDSKWKVIHTTSDAQKKEAFKRLSNGDFSGGLILVRGTSYANDPALHANYATDEKLSNDLLGLEPESVKQTIKRVLSKRE
ncbi:uncharacterized protein BHQ10_009189 [Talaromyces amestolkiae]|uniref:NmrA-like domain-containing protein n=1 Tax=Talaromyces amestolkiae TaxID=1196081 RepID=A0A364LBK8_TALAM|nr:uncharacterized protein BHQ10_009189 [Talaromyces amestolkiae]RAO73177.1 hypothetical protein BHQ10_009189 [Talaromyces amestolkiae]